MGYMLIVDVVSPKYLLTMPLHAVTEIHGEAGLRQRFLLEIDKFSDEQQIRIREALDLATELHRDDRRTREPYLNHLLRSATRVIRHYQVDDIDVVIATVLHDSVEDHAEELAGGRPGDPTEAALDVIAERFGDRVADLVRAVTNPEYDDDRDHHVQYREHVAESLEHNPWARVVKVSDFTDNGVGLIHTTPGPKLHKLARKYRPVVPILRDMVTRPDTPLADEVKQRIIEQLDLAEMRFDAILDTR
jgi:(p)ppGpp synthase/HD superfamily hydrolase